MAYGSRGFYPFLFESFPHKNCCLIVVDLLLFGWLCYWLNCLLNLFLAHKEGKFIFRTIAFGSLSQHIGPWVGGATTQFLSMGRNLLITWALIPILGDLEPS